jgi:hypothetical protein
VCGFFVFDAPCVFFFFISFLSLSQYPKWRVSRGGLYRYIVGRAPFDSIVSLKRLLAVIVREPMIAISSYSISAFEHTQPAAPSWYYMHTMVPLQRKVGEALFTLVLSKSRVLVWYVKLQIIKGRRKQTPFVGSTLHVGDTFLQASPFRRWWRKARLAAG